MSELTRTIEGDLTAAGLRFGLVVSRFNHFITDRLLEGALDCIRRHGGDLAQATVVRTPGAFEIPGVARQLCQRGGFDAIICLGAVIRGGTPHYDYICSEVIKGLGQLQLQCDIPIAYGVITPETIEQAIERAGTKAGNRGAEAAIAAIETANLYRQLSEG